MAVDAAHPDDAHRPLEPGHNLAASLSHVEMRQVRSDYTLLWAGKLYEILRPAITPGLRGANVRIEKRLDGTLAVRYVDRYLPMRECGAVEKPNASKRRDCHNPKTDRLQFGTPIGITSES